MKRLILTTLFLALISGLARGETMDDSWDNLKQLRVGQKIEVVDMSLKSLIHLQARPRNVKLQPLSLPHCRC